MKNLVMMAIVFAAIVLFSSCSNSENSQTCCADSTAIAADSALSVCDSVSIKVDTMSHNVDSTNQ